MNKFKFGRDLFVLLAVITLLASYSFIGKIHWTMSLAFLVLYGAYFYYFFLNHRFIGYVIYTETRKKKEPEEANKPAAENNLAAPMLLPPTSLAEEALKIEPLQEDKKEPPKTEESKTKPENKETSLKIPDPNESPKSLLDQLKFDAVDILRSTYYIDEYKEMSWFGKGMFFLVGGHYELLLKLSIPPYNMDKWDRRLAILFPIFGGLLTFVQMRIFHLGVLGVTFLTSIVLSGLIYYSTEKAKAPKFLLLFQFVGFVQSVQWMWFLCNISVDIFKLFIFLSDIEPAYVGLTFMACANSIGDIISDTTMARMGYSIMAITAAFAGPIFNIMMGIGITMTRNILKKYFSIICE